MKVKGMLKFALPALLLFGGASAIAADGDAVVTLKNGVTTKTWAEFSAAVSDLDAITGNIADLPASNAAAKALVAATQKKDAAKDAYDGKVLAQGGKQTALSEANSAVTTAQGTVSSKKSELTTAQNDSTAAETALATAQAQLTAAQAQLTAANEAYIKGFQDKVDAANASLTKKENTDLPKLENSLSQLNSQKTTVEGSLNSAEGTLTSLQAQYDALPRVKDTLPWLANIAKAANDWKNAEDANTSTNEEETRYSPVYIRQVTGTDRYGDPMNQLFISFVAPTNVADWTTCTTLKEYTAAIKDIVVANLDNFFAYMGSDYSAMNNGNTNLALTNPTKKAQILGNAASKINELTELAKYQGLTDKYENPTQEENLSNQIAAQKVKVNNLSIQLYGAHKDAEGKLPYGATEETDGIIDNINSTQKAIEDLNEEIETLRDTTIPGLEADVKTAQAAVESGDATSDAITAANNAIEAANGEVTDAEGVVEAKSKATAAAWTALGTANETLEANKAAAATAQTEFDDAKAETATALSEYNKALADLETATTNAENAADVLAQAQYNEITLTGNVLVESTINAAYGGTIKGGNNCFSFASGVTSVFNGAFTGTLTNAAINYPVGGKFATGSMSSAKFEDVATWNGTNGKLYDATDGRTFKEYTSLGELGFAAREFFGVNFKDNLLAKSTDDTKVYDIIVYTTDGKTESQSQYYVNYKNNQFINEATTAAAGTQITVGANTFVKSSTLDKDILSVPNLVYQEGNNYKCNNVVIQDKVSFYAPFQIQAQSVTLQDREFKQGYNSVCLPFELKEDYADGIQYLCTYDTETTEKFWFTKQSDAIAANTPVLMVTTKAITELNIPAVTIEKTPIEQFVTEQGATEEKSESYGTFKKCSVDQFTGSYNAYQIYGLNGDTFQPAKSTATFSAFRMALRSELGQRGSNAPRRIGIRDERGIEINVDDQSGVEDVASDMVSLEITAGAGEIIFNSDANYGKVEIFSIDGRVAAIADVVEGTTSVNVKHGVYIVMGKKILVK